MADSLSSSESLGSSKGLVGAAGLPGTLDGSLRLWTPHRTTYVSGAAKPERTGECPFCVAPSLSNTEAPIVARGRACSAPLNLYPYNSGHTLVRTYCHVSLYTDLTDEERIGMGSMTARVMEALGETLRPTDFNLGMGQGDVAGADIAAHIHQRVTPRWLGDANFLSIIAQTEAIPAILANTRNLVSEAWPRIDRGSTDEGSIRGGTTGKGPAREDPAGEEGSGSAQ